MISLLADGGQLSTRRAGPPTSAPVGRTLMRRDTDVINIEGEKIAPAPIEDRLREAWGSTVFGFYR
jgi:hypothetical protein